VNIGGKENKEMNKKEVEEAKGIDLYC